MIASSLVTMGYTFSSREDSTGSWGGVTMISKYEHNPQPIFIRTQDPCDLHQLADWLKQEAIRFERLHDEERRRIERNRNG